MRIPEERSHALMPPEQHHDTRTGCSRRTFLIGGAVAALAGGGWWLTTQFFQPPAMPVDTHRILSLPITTNLQYPGTPLQYLEYTWLPDSTHIAVAVQQVLWEVDVKRGQQKLVPSSQANTLLTHWSED